MPFIHEPVSVLAVLMGVLASLYVFADTIAGKKVFKIIPLLVFAYFIPTLLSNTGIIPFSSPIYTIIKKWLLPASLFLLTMSVDIPAILKLGKKPVLLFLGATLGIVIGGPLALLILGSFLPIEMGEEAWKGLAALAGSWIGGGANFIAIGESVGVSEATIGLIVVVDVVIANIWMAFLLYFAGNEKQMDDAIGADRSSIDLVRQRVESFQKKVARPTNYRDLMKILALAFITTCLATFASKHLPDIGSIVKGFTWIVIIVSTVAVGLSFTKVRKLEGAGASQVGSVFLYLLIASIGAKGDFSKVVDAPILVMIGALWMLFHAVTILILRRYLKAPIFFAAVGSQANVGGAASAPIVASAFHQSLASVGVLLAVGGYVLGTYAGLLTAFLLEWVYFLIH